MAMLGYYCPHPTDSAIIRLAFALVLRHCLPDDYGRCQHGVPAGMVLGGRGVGEGMKAAAQAAMSKAAPASGQKGRLVLLIHGIASDLTSAT